MTKTVKDSEKDLINRLEFANKVQRDYINELQRRIEIYQREFKIPKDFHIKKSVIHKNKNYKFIA